jgi:predicted CXXCH cytochrome family protein
VRLPNGFRSFFIAYWKTLKLTLFNARLSGDGVLCTLPITKSAAMNARYFPWVIFACFFYTAPCLAVGDCRLCGDNVISLGNFDKEIINKQPEICVNCHPDRLSKPEHVVNVKVIPPMAEPLPLLNGKVTCITCHDPFGTSKHLLRYDKKILCAACHKHK